MAKEGKPDGKKPVNQPANEQDESREQVELQDAELDQVSGGTMTNLANMRHEMMKAVANNLRG